MLQALKNIDYKIKIILFFTLVTDIISIGLYFWFPSLQNPVCFAGALYIAWCGSAAFFTVVGIVVAIASLERPERASFDARARILFRHASGPHIDYIIGRMKDIFGEYAELVEIDMKIVDYHPGEGKLRIDRLNRTVIRGYIDDIVSTFNSKIKMDGATAAPAGTAPNRLTFLKIDGQTSGAGELFDASLERNFSTMLDRGKPSEILHKAEFWVKADTERNTYSPIRYTQKIVAKIENNLVPGQAVIISCVDLKKNTSTDIVLDPGKSHTLYEHGGVEPRVKIYDFTIKRP